MVGTGIALFSLLVLVYCHVLYPLVVAARAKLAIAQPRSVAGHTPTVSVLLAAFNEEKVLARALTALGEIHYPNDSIEFLVGSDGSDDRTNLLIEEFAQRNPRIRPFLFSERRGKIPVLNEMAQKASGEILIFTDADVAFVPDACLNLVRHLADPTVGGVAGLITLHGDQQVGPLGVERGYLSTETRLRSNESRIHSTVGIQGGIYAIRRRLWSALPVAPICDELHGALRVIAGGYRMIFDPEALATEDFGRSIRDEYNRRKRFATRGLITLKAFPELLEPAGGWIALMLWSHKILRWLTPFLLLLFVIGTLVAMQVEGSHIAQVLSLAELLVVLAAGAGYFAERQGRQLPVLSTIYWFIMMNLAFGVGTLIFLFGSEAEFWPQPTRSGSGPSSAPVVPRRSKEALV